MDANGIIASLSSGDPARRERAAGALVDMSDAEAVRGLIRLLEDNHLEVRVAAARALGKSKDRAALEPLLTAQRSSDDPFRQAVSETLLQYGASFDIVPDLLARTKSPNPYSRKAAVWVLGELQDLRAFDAVSEALKDEKDFVRFAAGFAITKLRAKQQETLKREKPPATLPLQELLNQFAKVDFQGDKKHRFTPPRKDNGMLAR